MGKLLTYRDKDENVWTERCTHRVSQTNIFLWAWISHQSRGGSFSCQTNTSIPLIQIPHIGPSRAQNQMSTLPCVSFIMQPTVTEHTGKQHTTFIRCDAAGPLAVKIGISAVPVGEWEMMQTEWSCLSWPYVTPARLVFVSSEGERGEASANKGIKLSKKDTAYIRFPKSIKQLSFLC